MQAEIDRALDGLDDPVERLAAATCVRQREAFVAQSEFRSLSR